MTPDFDLDLAILLSELSVQAYREPEKLKLENLGVEMMEFIDDEKTHTQLYIFKDNGRIFIVFRGTESIKDLVNDAMIIKKKFPEVSRWILKPRVHHGFYYSYLQVKDKIIERITDINSTGKYQIIVAGHSLGAALATLCAFDFKHHRGLESTVYTFGSPRVGNLWFVRMFNKMISNSYRIVNDDDFVTTMPKIGYKHVETLIYIYRGGKMIVNPRKIKRITEKMDNLVKFLSGDGVIDHLEHNYLEVLQEVKQVTNKA